MRIKQLYVGLLSLSQLLIVRDGVLIHLFLNWMLFSRDGRYVGDLIIIELHNVSLSHVVYFCF